MQRQSRKHSVTLPLSPPYRASLLMNVISAQELIMDDTTTVKTGFLLCKSNRGIWKRRFVIVTSERVQIYTKETSQSPRRSVSLIGYQGVKRCTAKSPKAPWAFEVVYRWPHKSQVPMKFSCVSEQDRFSWMTAIKTSLYSANLIEKPVTVLDAEVQAILQLDDHRQMIDPFDNVYEEVETSVLLSDRKSSETSISSDKEDLYDEIQCDSSSGEEGEVFFESTGNSMKHGAIKKHSKKSCTSFASDENSFVHENGTVTHARRISEPALSSPGDGLLDNNDTDASLELPCPYQGLQHYAFSNDNEYDYATPRSSASLSIMCWCVDSDKSLEELLDKLRDTPTGTYLIRKSRTDVLNVLCVHQGEAEIASYVILEKKSGELSLDGEEYFEHLDQLLRAYTVRKTLPKLGMHLGTGVHAYFVGEKQSRQNTAPTESSQIE